MLVQVGFVETADSSAFGCVFQRTNTESGIGISAPQFALLVPLVNKCQHLSAYRGAPDGRFFGARTFAGPAAAGGAFAPSEPDPAPRFEPFAVRGRVSARVPTGSGAARVASVDLEPGNDARLAAGGWLSQLLAARHGGGKAPEPKRYQIDGRIWGTDAWLVHAQPAASPPSSRPPWPLARFAPDPAR